MRKLIFIFSVLMIFNSCSSDDNNSEEEQEQGEQDNSVVLGSWTREETLGGIDGTKTFTFNANWKYTVELVRVEDFNGPCSLDPYCDNDYSGDYWFSGNSLCIDSDYHGWTECYSWSVSGDRITIHGENYYK